MLIGALILGLLGGIFGLLIGLFGYTLGGIAGAGGLRRLASAVLALIGLSLAARSEQIGPSFDCHVAQQPLAQMLCADPDLSRTDLRFAQVYFALLKQVGDAGKRELKEEDLRFLEAVQRQCGIPPRGKLYRSQSRRGTASRKLTRRSERFGLCG